MTSAHTEKGKAMSRYIDAEWIRNVYADFKDYEGRDDWTTPISNVLAVIDDAPSIDIVRCQDCKHWVYNFNGCSRNPCTEPWYATDYCNYGERKESE